MHIDLNAFFSTAEQIKNPTLKGLPVIVGGTTSRGVVSTCSYEARKYKVHSGMPIFEAKRLCPQGIFLPPDFPYYEMLSRSFFSYLKKYSSKVEEASIDEGYVDLTSLLSKVHDPYPILHEIQDGLKKEIGLNSSLGIASTKFLAKMASDFKKPMGITIIRKRDIPAMLYPLPVSSFFGIGRKTAPRLENIGIKTIGDLAKKLNSDDEETKDLLGKFFFTAKEWINGRGDNDVHELLFDPKSLGHSETLPFDTNDYALIKNKIKELSFRVAYGLKKDKKVCRTITLTTKDQDFQVHSKAISFKEETKDPEVIYEKAITLYTQNFLGEIIRLVGVTASHLKSDDIRDQPLTLFNFEEMSKIDETRILIESLNKKMGKRLLFTLKEKKDGHPDSY